MMIHYFVTGMVVLVASWALSGCRLGNHVEAGEGPDKFSGYYEVQPQALGFYFETLVNGSIVSKTVPVPTDSVTTLMPPLLSFYMTNPIYLLLASFTTGEAYIENYSKTGGAIPTVIDPATGKMSFSGKTKLSTVWDDSSCQYQFQLVTDGAFNKGTNSVPNLQGNDLKGRIGGNITIVHAFTASDACATSMKKLSLCYADVANCTLDGDTNQNHFAWVQGIFQSYIQAGAFTVDTIPSIRTLAYQVSYQ